MCDVGLDLCPRTTDPTIPPPISSGIRSVEIRKALVRTRSRYSRFAMSQTLCIDPVSYRLNKDLFECRLHDLKSCNPRLANGCSEQRLPIVAVTQFDLGHAVVVLSALNRRMPQKRAVS